MREWDQMIARQVSADGVRTTWGEHVAPPGGEVTMTDDRILSAERVARDLLTIRIESPHGVPVNVEWVEELVASHEALRARLTAAEAERDQAIREQRERDEFWMDMLDGVKVLIEAHLDPVLSVASGAVRVSDRDRLCQVLTELDDLPGIASEWKSENHVLNDRVEAAEAKVAALTAERDEAVRLREADRERWELTQKSELTNAQVQVAALTEALRDHASCRHYTTIDFVSVCAVCADRDEDCPMRAALAAADQTDEGDE